MSGMTPEDQNIWELAVIMATASTDKRIVVSGKTILAVDAALRAQRAELQAKLAEAERERDAAKEETQRVRAAHEKISTAYLSAWERLSRGLQAERLAHGRTRAVAREFQQGHCTQTWYHDIDENGNETHDVCRGCALDEVLDENAVAADTLWQRAEAMAAALEEARETYIASVDDPSARDRIDAARKRVYTALDKWREAVKKREYGINP